MQVFVKAKVVYKGGSMDISERIESFKYVHSAKKDNYLEIKIKKEYVPSLMDDERIVNGNTIVFHWGIVGGSVSRVHSVKLQDPIISYAERVSLTIKGLDMGNTMKKTSIINTPTKTQQNNFETQILKPIADKYSLKVDTNGDSLASIDPNSIGPMAGSDDLNYLKGIASKNGFICYVDGSKLIFKKRNLAQKSKRTLTYGDGTGVVVSFNPKANETTSDTLTGQLQNNSIDPLTGAIKTTSGVSNETALGKYTPTYNANADTVGAKSANPLSWGAEDKPVKNIASPDDSYNENASNKAAADNQLKQITADLIIVGDPNIEADIIISMNGVSKRDSGNWYVEETTHSLSPSGEAYMCHMSMSKNGSSSPINVNPETTSDVNNTTGATGKTAATKKIPMYDGNGKELKA